MASGRKPMLMQVAQITTDGVRLATVRADSIREPTKPRHVRLTDAQVRRADELFRRVGHWFGPTPSAWRDGFLYDLHPDAELNAWEHIADVVNALWVAEPKALDKLNRERLTRLVVAVSTRIVDIPSQMPDVTDAMVEAAKAAFASGSATATRSSAEPTRLALPSGESGRITVDPEMMFGKPCIRGLRYPVEFVLELLDSGMTRDEILADYEDLEAADLMAATEYASDQGSTRRAQMAVA